MNDGLFKVIQEEFVDREAETRRYNTILHRDNSGRIFSLRAEDGWGKSWLLMRLILDTPKKYLRTLIDLGSTEAKDEEALLERICEKMGGVVSGEMAKDIDAPPGNVSIRAGGNVNIRGDVIVGNKLIVNHPGGKNNHISVEVNDPYAHDQRVRRLTRSFKSGLEQLPKKSWAILFLDRFDSATKVTRDWLVDILFTGLLNGEYSNLIVVVTSILPINRFEAREWKAAVVQDQIGGLPPTAIQEYWLRRRHLPEAGLKTILRRAAHTSPLELSHYADKVERAQ